MIPPKSEMMKQDADESNRRISRHVAEEICISADGKRRSSVVYRLKRR